MYSAGISVLALAKPPRVFEAEYTVRRNRINASLKGAGFDFEVP
jgi:hypothetical protein